MDTDTDSERIPDPFEVGEDDLDDEPPSSLMREQERQADTSPYHESEIIINSGQASNVISRAISPTPPLPPKDPTPLAKPHFIHGLPSLISPSLFLPIPDADPLTMLLAKYVPNPDQRPRRDLSGDYTHTDLQTLIMTNSWRATARFARDQLISTNPVDVDIILELWSLRLNSLARLRLYNQTAAECTALFTTMSNIQPPESREYLMRELLPLDLELCRARLRYWAEDHTGYVDTLMSILKECKIMSKVVSTRDGQAAASKWLDKASRVAMVLASQLIEMKQYSTATRLLETMVTSSSSSPELRSVLASIYLQTGNLTAANFHLEALDDSEDPDLKASNAVLKSAFLGDWQTAIRLLRLRSEAESSRDKHIQRMIDANNLAVALLNVGQLTEAIGVLEDAFRGAPSLAVVAEPLIFNLATMYELQSNTGTERKIGVLLQVAQWSGDGMRHTALKLG